MAPKNKSHVFPATTFASRLLNSASDALPLTFPASSSCRRRRRATSFRARSNRSGPVPPALGTVLPEAVKFVES